MKLQLCLENLKKSTLNGGSEENAYTVEIETQLSFLGRAGNLAVFQKEHYLYSTGISYIKSNLNITEINSNIFNNINYNHFIRNGFENNAINKNYDNNFHNNLLKNNSIGNFNINEIYNNVEINALNTLTSKENCYKTINLADSFEIHKILQKPIKQILMLKTFFTKINNNKLLKKVEFNYLKSELNKKGIDIYIFFNGCLDCIKDFDKDA